VTFPEHFDITRVSQAVLDDYPFLEGIKKVSETSLEVRLDNIADLFDLDFINSYGAKDVKLSCFDNAFE
jgi:hypothetical protein